MFGLNLAVRALDRWNGEESRFARERQHPVDYLSHSYYENWLAGLEKLLVEKGVVSAAELAAGKAEARADESARMRVLHPDAVAARMSRGSSSTLPVATQPRFKPGERVRALNHHPRGHTRLPRYVRGRVGLVESHRGAHVFPDLNAVGTLVGRHLYTVRFDAAELWGKDAAERSAVYVDMWESYLEPAG
jgi:nitrile hydratase